MSSTVENQIDPTLVGAGNTRDTLPSLATPANMNPSRLKPPGETLSAIHDLLSVYNIEGYADHTLDGFDILRSIEVIRGNPRSGYLNLGKGFGFEAALASGCMEAIEMCTIETAPQVPLIEASHVASGSWIYGSADRKSYRLDAQNALEVSSPLIVGVDLLTGEDAFGFAHENFLPTEHKDDVVHVSTNGLASGNSVSEARLHAVYEIIERHIVAASLRALQTVSALVLRDVPSPLREAIAEIDAAGMRAEFFLLGTELDVPVILCALSLSMGCSEADADQVHFGFAAHHGVAVAISKALSEAFQACATRSACRRGVLPSSRMKGGLLMSAEHLNHLKSGATEWEKLVRRRLEACVTRDLWVGHTDAQDAATPEQALNRLLGRAREAGISHLFSWSLSPQERPFSVVKCVIPEFGTFF